MNITFSMVTFDGLESFAWKSHSLKCLLKRFFQICTKLAHWQGYNSGTLCNGFVVVNWCEWNYLFLCRFCKYISYSYPYNAMLGEGILTSLGDITHMPFLTSLCGVTNGPFIESAIAARLRFQVNQVTNWCLLYSECYSKNVSHLKYLFTKFYKAIFMLFFKGVFKYSK